MGIFPSPPSWDFFSLPPESRIHHQWLVIANRGDNNYTDIILRGKVDPAVC